MLARRIIACLDVAGGRVVKGTRFVDLRDMGDPVELAARYERDGADEIVFLDIAASASNAESVLDLARRAAERVFIPLTIGGGIRSADEMAAALRAGADKVSVNSAAVARPQLLTECASRFGSQCVVASIDAKRTDAGGYEVYVRGGRVPTGLDAVEWAARCVDAGAGEILLTSIDRDGERGGYDIDLTRRVVDAVSVPVVASGGAGAADDVADVFVHAAADAALVAGILHDGSTTIGRIKRRAAERGLDIRATHAE
jgi:imidazole glycerol-phosphate synthase subunit HisF